MSLLIVSIAFRLSIGISRGPNEKDIQLRVLVSLNRLSAVYRNLTHGLQRGECPLWGRRLNRLSAVYRNLTNFRGKDGADLA